MTVKCEAMPEAPMPNRQVVESNQAGMGDDSTAAKTIEFLRARLLAERAASKSARQQAQETAEKVKDLHTRLEMEIEQRKEAETAILKVFSVLKAKGVDVDGTILATFTDLKGLSEDEQAMLVGDINFYKAKASFEVITPQTTDLSMKKEVTFAVENRTAGKDVCNMGGANGLHGNNPAADTVSNSDAPSTDPAERKVAPSMSFAEHQHCSIDKVQDADGVCPDQHEGANELHGNTPAAATVSDSDGPSTDPVEREVVPSMSSMSFAGHQHCSIDKVQDADEDVHPDQHASDCIEKDRNIQQGHGITSKLKAMLRQIEDEVGALPKEQPLRVELQGWVNQVACMLDKGQEAALNYGLENHHLVSSKHPDDDCLSETLGTALETKNIIHTKMSAKSYYADAIHAVDFANEIHDTDERVDRREAREGLEKRSLLPVLKTQMQQQRHFVPSISTLHTRTCKDTSLHGNVSHQRMSSSELITGGCMPAYAPQDPFRPWPPQTVQYENSHSKVAYPPTISCSCTPIGNSYIGSESPYLVEVPSPKSSDVPSVGERMVYVHGPHNELWSPYRASAFERQNAWHPWRGEDCNSLSNGYFPDDTFGEGLFMKPERGSNEQKIHLQGGHPFPLKDVRNHSRRGHFPPHHASLSVADDTNGRLGGILMALDAARQHVQEEELIGPVTPRVADPRARRAYRCGSKIQQSSSSESPHEPWMSPSCSNHTPIIQFPPSPSSEHGYSPFERQPCVHRRSSSVSTNFMMPGWDGYLQPRGEVHLGNGITLYTD